jgi:hypothetical protein
MPNLPAPQSKSELLARARQEARMSLGRAAFVRDARVLPIGVPLALGAAAVVYSRVARPRRSLTSLASLGRRRRAETRAAGAAALALVGAVAVAYVAARVEWDLRRRAWRAGRGD